MGVKSLEISQRVKLRVTIWLSNSIPKAYTQETENIKKDVAQLCPILFDPMDYSLPGSSVHGIF